MRRQSGCRQMAQPVRRPSRDLPTDPLDIIREDPAKAAIGTLLLSLAAFVTLLAILLPGGKP